MDSRHEEEAVRLATMIGYSHSFKGIQVRLIEDRQFTFRSVCVSVSVSDCVCLFVCAVAANSAACHAV